MDQLVRWELEDGGTVLVETASEDVARGGWASAGVGADTVHEAKLRMEEALGHLRGVATAALKTFRELPVGPDEVEIEFGVKLASEAGAVIAKAKAEGQLVVRLRWQAPDRSG
ncbi:CU044_2847 family protein [Nonomuraea maritima]|uniref:CU044_2847 family protein n=1 Tax=Nonomuraea maritima TaxID=683260 RepID=UPI000B82C2EB|nr:CU044_2847 family protein [Nonomuraea maritima]